ncbi:cupin-like domain-containing protein [Erythrobacter sp. LQ02-29]|uniref:cupin-like domain-containing protein n=1 Tax=Erythrobacter sp. LQ02-29 TaxID=2920384 RepID=UPI001F4DE284|nr:cupin-like domain-containing protein [Erythrobacter sp. LQ02-29]MCP9223551.1 cupin-like domain-containing protein [Erythrobacter sp. LQ02-29]
MSVLAPAPPIEEIEGPIDAARLEEIRAAGRPLVLRGLVRDWPLVRAGREGNAAVVEYLSRRPATRPVRAIAAPAEEKGRFFYNRDLSGFNFHAAQGALPVFLADLLKASRMPDPPALAVQSIELLDVLPDVARENRLELLPQVRARIWIGNRIRVAPHYDIKENVACCVAGRRRFTVFPPDQIANLYPGPLELTPAGTPVSMVDPDQPDLDAYPRFARAWETARAATLEPGDAIYLPYCWWHGVESLDPVSALVNYWWTEGLPEGIGPAYDALLHAMLAFRHLPPEQREVWRGMLDYYVFESEGDPAAHLPAAAKGVLGPPSAGLFARMRQVIRQALG